MSIKTIEGLWLTPTPITIKVDEESEAEEGVIKFITERGHIKISVRRIQKVVNGIDKIQRHLTLTETETDFNAEGRANLKVDRITWDNGSAWTRPGATLKDRKNNNNMNKNFMEPGIHEAETPDDASGGGCCFFCRSSGGPPSGEGGAAPVDPVDEAAADARNQEILEKEGFLNDDQVNDVVERINGVIGLWGVSEEREAEFIKPPVEIMNKKMKEAMLDFLNPKLVALLAAIMDDDVGPDEKASMFSKYFQENFVQPLCTNLTTKVADQFGGFEWMKAQLNKIISMMSQQVSDEIMSKAVEQLNDSDAVS